MFYFLLLLYTWVWCVHEALKISNNINIIFCDKLSATNCPRRIVRTPSICSRLENLYTEPEAVHKVRHARGKEVREGVTVYDRGRGARACIDVTLLNFF